MNLRILVLRTLESIQIWSIYERNISRAVSSISSPPLGISLCYLCSTHPSSPWGQLAWRMKWRPLGLMLGVCHLKPSADFFLRPCSLPISISLSLLLSLPYCMNPNPNPSFCAKPSSPTLDSDICTNHSPPNLSLPASPLNYPAWLVSPC